MEWIRFSAARSNRMPDRNAGVGATGHQPVPVAASARLEALSISVGKSAPDPSGPPAIAAAVQNSPDGSAVAPRPRGPACQLPAQAEERVVQLACRLLL